MAAALLHGLLELVERDAAALWWRGGQPPRPLALEDPALAAGLGLLAALRRGAAGRLSLLLDLTGDLGVPVMAALSFGPDGRGFCCGTAARPGRAAAARAAVREMAQMELAAELVLAKRALRGEAGLSPRDRALLHRYEGIGPDLPGLHPLGAARPDVALPEAPGEALPALLGRLAAAGAPAFAVELSRGSLMVPVVRALCPGLEVEPGNTAGPRLLRTLSEWSGRACGNRRIALM